MLKNLSFLALLIIALLAVCLMFLTGYFEKYLFNSDALYLPILFVDLFHQQGHLNDWYLTPAPYFFPDYAIFFVAYWLAPNAYWQILLFFIGQFLILLFAIYVLLRQVLKENHWVTSVFIVLFLLWFAVDLIDGFVYLMTSAYHYGSFIVQLLFIALWFYYCKRSSLYKNIASIVLMSLISFLVSLSDNIFVVQTLLPFMITILFFSYRQPRKIIYTNLLGLIPVVLGILGSCAYYWFIRHPTRYQTQIDLSLLGSNLESLNYLFGNLISKSALLDVFVTGYIFLMLMLIYNMVVVRERRPLMIWFNNMRQEIGFFDWLLVFSCVSFVIMLLVFLFGNTPLRARYMIPVLSWPVILVTIVASCYLKHYFYTFGLSLSSMVVTLMLLIAFKLIYTKGLMTEYYAVEMACIDDALEKEGLRNGISQYWDAKYFKAFSRLNLNIAQYFDNLERHRWITSEGFYKDSYDFAVIFENAIAPYYKISKLTLVGVNGPPKKIISCGDRTLYIYGKNKMHV